MDAPVIPVHPHGIVQIGIGEAHENTTCCYVMRLQFTPHPSSHIFMQIMENNVIGSWTSSPSGFGAKALSYIVFHGLIVMIFRSVHSNNTSS